MSGLPLAPNHGVCEAAAEMILDDPGVLLSHESYAFIGTGEKLTERHTQCLEHQQKVRGVLRAEGLASARVVGEFLTQR